MAKVIAISEAIHEVHESRNNIATPIKYIINEDGCHICISHALDKDGYPRIFRGKDKRMSRYIYSLLHGEIPPGMIVMHTCDNPRCINPDHLKLGTHKDNMLDKVKKGRSKNISQHVLTIDEICYIRFESKETTRALALKYGVIEQTIRYIRQNKTHKNITEELYLELKRKTG